MNRLTLAATSLPDISPLEMFDVAADAGFDGVGLRINRTPTPGVPFHPIVGDSGLIRAIRRRARETGMEIQDLFSFYLLPDLDLGACEAAMTVGADFGARYAVVVGRDAEPARAAQTFATLCDLAAPLDLTLVLEFAPHRYPTTLEQALQLLAAAERRNAALMPDPAHLFGSGGTLEQLRAVDRRLLRYSQYCDVAFAPVTRTIERRLPGEGELSLREWLRALPDNITLSLECLPRPARLSPAQWAAEICTRTRQSLAELTG